MSGRAVLLAAAAAAAVTGVAVLADAGDRPAGVAASEAPGDAANLPVGAVAAAPAVTAAFENGGRRTPCPPLEVRDLEVSGGCQIAVPEATARFTILNLFGDRRFAVCGVGFTIAVGPAGELAVSDVVNLAASTNSAGGPCGDILACRRSFDVEESWQYKRPWRGRLAPAGDGAFRADLELCVDTCIGRLEGPVRLTLHRAAKGAWRMRADAAAVGTSGLEIDGAWTLPRLFGDALVLTGDTAGGA